MTKPDFVTTEPVTRLSCNKTQILSQQSFSNKLYCDKIDFVATELVANFVAKKTRFYHGRANDKAFLQQNPDFVATEFYCDTPSPGVPLTTRQPSEYSWMSSNATPQYRVPFSGTHDLMKIGQSHLCMGSSTKNTTCTITWQHGPLLCNDHTGSTYE